MDTRFDLQVNKKAFQINLDDRVYGTFAEIGAGQEVARRFFHVGGASHTIAKTISAYDMTFSDAIYGSSGRYVSRDRLSKMLDHEFELLHQRLDVKVGDRKTFFVFANTVAARNIRQHDEAHGWLGIRFQTAPRAPLNEIIVHVRMLDTRNIEQQEALGIIGVNLIYGAYYHYHKPEAMIASLLDDLSPERMEVDMIRLSGPDFKNVDNRLMSLQLVSQGLTKATLFQANGEVVQAADVFYKKPLLVERGSFRPVTKVTNDMLDCALSMFLKDDGLNGGSPEVLMEITMQNLLSSGELDLRDFLDRIDILSSLGRTVLISNYGEYYRLVNFLTRYTEGMVGLALGIPSLQEIFDEKYYTNLEGGILEGLGRLFKTGVKLYVYPRIEPDGSITEAGSYTVAPNLKYLYTHLLENHFIQSLTEYNKEYLTIQSREVLEKIRQGDSTWETMVPSEVTTIIKERKLFGLT
ncbi:MAG: TonB-dependent receptor [Chthoniobacterales bacterium]